MENQSISVRAQLDATSLHGDLVIPINVSVILVIVKQCNGKTP